MTTTNLIFKAVLLLALLAQGFPVAAFKAAGHYNLTVSAAEKLNFSDRAKRILGLAAVSPDYYDWDKAAAHGQTPNCQPDELSQFRQCAEGMPAQDLNTARQAFFNYLIEQAHFVNNAVKLEKPDEVLYRLGYTLHALQDLASHNGITNAEHAYRSYLKNDDPDDIKKYGARYELARQWTVDFLNDVRGALGCDWEKLRTYAGSFPNSDERALIQGIDSDLTWGKYKFYKKLAEAFDKLPLISRSVTWGNSFNPRDTMVLDSVGKTARDKFIEALGGRGVLLDAGTYHLGDGEFEDTADLETVITNKLVGEKYQLSFESEAPAKVRVKLCKLYGVDYGGRIWIDGKLAGRFSSEHNQGSYVSDPVEIKAGRHTLIISADIQPTNEDETVPDADDLVFEKVTLQTLFKQIPLKALGPGTISREHP